MVRIEVGVPPQSIRTGSWPGIVSWEARARFREPSPLGSLHVTSSPSGAPVLLNGLERGKTPLRIDAVFPGQHSIRVEEPRFRFQERQVEVIAGEREEAHFELETIRDVHQLALNRRLSGRWGSEEILASSEQFGRGTLFSASLFPEGVLRVVWSSDGNLWLAERKNAWHPARELPAPINSESREHSPILVSLDRDSIYLAWLRTGDRRVDRRFYSISTDAVDWSTPDIAEGFFPPYRTVYAGGQAQKEGPVLTSLPDGRILMLGHASERSGTGTEPVGFISRRISEDGQTWEDAGGIEVPFDSSRGGFPLTFGPYCSAVHSRILVTLRSHGDLRTQIHAIPGLTNMVFSTPRSVLDSGTHALYDLTETRPLILRDGRMVVYWREAGNPFAQDPMKQMDRIEYTISRDGETWRHAEKPLLLFPGQIGSIKLVETERGEGLFLYEEDGVLKALSCPSLTTALRN